MSEAERLFSQNLEFGRRLGNESGIARSLYQLGRLAEAHKELESAWAFYEEANQIFERLDEKPDAALSKQSLDRIKQLKRKAKY